MARFSCRMLAVALISFAPAPAWGQAGDEAVLFEPLPTESPVAAIAVSEDGAWLFSAHETANQVLVWSVRTGEKEATIETDSPRALLHRDGRLYVGSFGAGHVRALAEEDDWDLDNEFSLTGNPKVFHLSAPRGRSFQDVLLVNAVNEQGGIGYLLDVKKDRHQRAQLKQAAYVDAGGKFVALFGDNGYGPGKVNFMQAYNELLAGKGHGPTRSRDHCHFLPGYDGVYWFGSGYVWIGQPPQPVKEEQQGTVIPDLSRGLYYSLKDGVLSARLLSGDLPEVSRRPYQFSDAFQDGSLVFDERSLRFYEPVAVTDGDRLFIYVLDSASQKIFRGETDAFEVISASPGRTMEYALSGGDPGSYELLNGPAGLKVSPDGVLSWRPSRKDLGAHVVKLKLKHDGRSVIEQHAIQVAGGADVAGAGRSSPNADVKEASPDAGASAQRIWVDRSGNFRIQAEFVGRSGDNVRLQREDGRVIEVPLARLSDPDQEWVSRASGGWTTFVADEGGFRVDFPGAPQKESREDGDGAETITYGVELPEENKFYGVLFSRLGEDVAEMDRRVLLESAVASFGDDLKSKKLIKLGEHQGMEAVMQVDQEGTLTELTMRIFAVKGDLYQVMAAQPVEGADAAQTAKFLDSFRLPEAAPAGAISPRRTWADATGAFTIDAVLMRIAGENVVLRRDNGAEVQVPLARLSAGDQQYVKNLNATEAEFEKLRGVWRKVSHDYLGEDYLAQGVSQVWRIEGRRLIEDDSTASASEVTLNLNADPKHIDIGGDEKGIYKLEGDILTVCHAILDEERPKEFRSEKGKYINLIVLKRVPLGEDPTAPRTLAGEGDVDAEYQKLAGIWRVKSYIFGGEDRVAQEMAPEVWRIEGRQLIEGDDEPEQLTLDPGHDPKRIDRDEILAGIYKLEGDTLTVCFGPTMFGRPQKFESPSGELYHLIVLERDSSTAAAGEEPHVGVKAPSGSFAAPGPVLEGHQEVITRLAFSPDGKILASGDERGEVILWDAAAGKRIQSFSADDEEGFGVRCLAFMPRPRYLFVRSRHFQIWDTQREELIRSYDLPYDAFDAELAPDGQTAASPLFDEIFLVDLKLGNETKRLVGHAEGVVDLAFSPDGAKLVSGSDDGTARIWEIASGKEVQSLLHENPVSKVAFSPDGATVYVGTGWKEIGIWDAATGVRKGKIDVEIGSGELFALAPRAPVLVYEDSEEGHLVALDLKTQEELATFGGEWWGLSALAFSPRGDMLASAVETEDDRYRIHLWSISPSADTPTP